MGASTRGKGKKPNMSGDPARPAQLDSLSIAAVKFKRLTRSRGKIALSSFYETD